MKDFVSSDDSLILTHEGYDRIKGELEDGSKTLLEMFKSKAKQFPNNKLFGAINSFLDIEYISYSSVNQCAIKISQYLSKITNPGEIVGIASVNKPEWYIAEYATYYSNCINAPLYSTFKEEALSYVLSITQMRVLIAAPSFAKMLIEKVLNYIEAGLIKLEYIILMESDTQAMNLCLSNGIKVTTFNDLLFGDATKDKEFLSNSNFTICAKAEKYFFNNFNTNPEPNNKSRGQPKSEDIATICFTSGTTGIPKGVQLTHRNFISQIEAYVLSDKYYEVLKIYKNDIYFSYLPLSHVLERICAYFVITAQASICFFRGDKSKIAEDLKIVKPSILACVPKVLQSFYQKIEDKIAEKSFFQRLIFRASVSIKIFLQKFNVTKVSLLDNFVFKKVAEGFGGNIREVLCGGAALDSYLAKYFMAVLNVNVYQGYGQTEGLGACSIATKSMKDLETIGQPFPSTKFKLVSVDSGVGSTSPEKALFLKGHSVMENYFCPSEDILKRLLDTGKFTFKIENIKENPFDEDGWLITGDIVIYKDKKLYIVGRSKDLVKLDNGEYISPERIENKLVDADYVNDIFITKIKGEDKFVALVSSINEKASLFQIVKNLKISIDRLMTSKLIPRCTEIAKVAIVRQAFLEIDDGALFTPTMKKKRFIFAKKFANDISKSVLISEFLMLKSINVVDSSIVQLK